jgi:hypothetical protein
MDTLTSLLKDSTLQAFVWSPLAGVIFSVLLSPSASGGRSAVTVNQAVNSYNNHYNSHNTINSHNSFNIYADTSTNSTGEFTLLFALVGPAVYLNYAPLALHWVIVAAMFILAMSAVLFIRGLSTGALADAIWMFRIFVPPVIGAAALPVSQAALTAYYNPTGSGWLWTIMQALGVLTLCFSLLVAGLSLIHSTALLGVPDPENVGSVRIWVVQATRLLARPTSLVIAIVFVVVSPLLINGSAMEWLTAASNRG